jgi:hypothetical protein
MARPTKYNDDMLAKANEYLLTYSTAIPSYQGLALHLDVALSTVDKWGVEHDEFSGTLRKIKYTQFVKALDGGITGDYNAKISGLVLHNHGLSEKTEINNISTDGSMSPVAPTKIELVAYEAEADDYSKN